MRGTVLAKAITDETAVPGIESVKKLGSTLLSATRTMNAVIICMYSV